MSTSISPASGSHVSLNAASFGTELSALSPEERILALTVYTQSAQMAEAKTTIDLNAEELEKLREQVRKAIDDARAAEKKSGFWGSLAKLFGSDLASIAAAVAAVAATVATGGAAAAVLAVVATAASFAAQHAEELGIPPELAMGIAIGASVAGLVSGNAGSLFKVGEAVQKTADTVKLVAKGAELSLRGTGAALSYHAAGYAHDAAYASADARSAEGQQELVNGDMDEALDRFSSALSRQNGAVRLTSQMQQEHAASQFAILSNFGGAA
jgi:hypothetical protein